MASQTCSCLVRQILKVTNTSELGVVSRNKVHSKEETHCLARVLRQCPLAEQNGPAIMKFEDTAERNVVDEEIVFY